MQTLSAPVISGETVGEVCAYINNEKIYSLPITAANTIKEKKLCILLETIAKTSNIYRQIMTIIL